VHHGKVFVETSVVIIFYFAKIYYDFQLCSIDDMDKLLLSNHFKLNLKLVPPYFSRTYGVTIDISIGNEITGLKYEVKVTYIKTIAENIRLFRLDRLTPVYINETLPDTTADQLAAAVGEVFYPLFIEVNFEGKYLAVHNQNEIAGRWPALKEKISAYFTGEEATQYLNLMVEVLYDENSLNEVFRKDLFITSYFTSLYKSYTSSFELNENMYFPIVTNTAPVSFGTKQSLDEQFNSYGAIEIHHQGTVNDERTAEDLESGVEFPLSRFENPDLSGAEGVYNAKYVLNPNTRSLELLVASWHMPGMRIQSTEIRMFRIDEEHEHEKETLPLHSGNNLVYIDGGHSGKGGISGFLESIFGKKGR